MTYPLALPHHIDAHAELKATHCYQTNTPGNPTGFAISTALDLANLAIMHLNRGRFGGSQILAPELIAQMHALHADLFAAPGRGYGLTFWLDPYKGVQRVNHGGSIMTFRCYLELVPNASVGLVLLANRWDIGSPVLDALVDSTLDRLLNLPRQVSLPEDVPPDPAIWSRYAGHYWSHVNGIAMVRVVEDQLRLDWNSWKVALRPLADDRYIGQDVSLSVGFVADAAGTIRHLLIGLPGWSMTFGRADPAFVPDPAGWQQYAGVYLLDDDLIDYVEKLNVRVADGKIWFNIDTEGDEEALGVPIGETAFATRYGLFEFQLAGGVQSAKFADEFMYVKS